MNRVLHISNIKQKYLKIQSGTLPNRIFWVCYGLLLAIHCIENTSVIYSDAVWVRVMYLFRNFLYAVLLIRTGLFSRFRKKEMIYATIFAIVGTASVIGSRDFTLLELFIMIFAVKDQAPRRLVTVFAAVKGAGMIITLFLWRIGLLAAMYYQDDIVGYYNTYGFCHRNVLAANVVVLCLAWFYLRYKKLKIWDVVVWCAVAVILYKFALSRTGLLILLLIIFTMFLFRKRQKLIFEIPHFRTMVLGGFLALFLVSVIGTLFYSGDSEAWKLIDSIFTKRFRFANQCLEEYGLSLFGQNLPFVSSMEAQNSEGVRLILDNSFMRALLYYGLIPGGLFLWIYFRALDVSIKKRNARLAVSLMVFAVFGLSERYMLDAYYQFPLIIAWSGYFFKRESRSSVWKTPLEYMEEMVVVLRARYLKGKGL